MTVDNVRPRSRTAIIISAFAAMALIFATAGPASAHHGWSEFDTRHAQYVAGTLTDVNWSNPHVQVTLNVQDTQVPDGWLDRELPAGLAEIGGRDTMLSTRAYTGGQPQLHLILANIESFPGWGLNRPLHAGERIEAVGYLNRDHHDELRPETIWVDNGQAVRQRLLSLPDKPEPAPAFANQTTGATHADGSAPASSTGAGTVLAWILAGISTLVLLGAGGWYLRRRGNRT